MRVVEDGGGALYLVQGGNAWPLNPDQFSDLAALNPSGQFDGAVIIGSVPPARLVEDDDGNLYLVQGGNTQAFIPEQISDSALAALTLGDWIYDGTIGPPAAHGAPGAPASSAITAPADLTGKAANDLPGTLIDVPFLPISTPPYRATISSMVDQGTKPHDVFAMALTGGNGYGVEFSSPNNYGGTPITYEIINPDSTILSTNKVDKIGSIEVVRGGTYYLKVNATGSGQRYAFSITQGKSP
jgi:hypothetical protein